MRVIVDVQLEVVVTSAAKLGEAAQKYADATAREVELETERPRLKSEAISRIMALEDPQKPGKTYSATAAEAVVTFDKVYAQHRAGQAQAAFDTIVAHAEYEAAKIAALGDLELVKLAVAQESNPAVVIGSVGSPDDMHYPDGTSAPGPF